MLYGQKLKKIFDRRGMGGFSPNHKPTQKRGFRSFQTPFFKNFVPTFFKVLFDLCYYV